MDDSNPPDAILRYDELRRTLERLERELADVDAEIARLEPQLPDDYVYSGDGELGVLDDDP